ncbi:protein kinase family protein [Actinomadura rifamycini]|uniref:protein kinase family protein n=1 Tax=Actinomadura rifamycini TaxID=31962 RepID=UPI00040E1D46|nr:AMP-binding protein [Actinomadura rifamycini]
MSTSMIEPGNRLAGRYRLEKRIKDSGGSTLWKAVDEILARAVAVRTFDPEFPRIAEVVTSARSASRLTDPRLTQVFDADDSGESAYVVSEWVVGETLEGMLAKAPLEPGRAATLLYEASEAMAAAHAAGLSHLCLAPGDLVWTTGGTVKLLGIATDAVLRDRTSADPAAEDVRGLGRLLYAALTAHWPGGPDAPGASTVLPAAPATDGVPHPPRQVQAGISHAVDAIVCRCLGIEQGAPGGEPIATPAELTKALRGVPRTPLPLFAGLGSTQPPPRRPAAKPAPPPHRPHHTHQPNRADHGHRAAPPPPRRPPSPDATAQIPQRAARHDAAQPTRPARHTPSGHRAPGDPAARKPANRALMGIAAAALTVIVGVGAWALTSSGDDTNGDPNGGVTDPAQQTNSAAPSPSALRPQGIEAAEKPIGNHPDATIRKNKETLIDGSPSGGWETQTYADTGFGRLTEGLGVTLDMGKPVNVASVKVACPVSGGTLQVKVGDSASPEAMKPIGQQPCNKGELTFTANPAATGQYVLAWFTELPGTLKGRLGEVTVYGN